MGVFLGLGDAQLLQARFATPFRRRSRRAAPAETAPPSAWSSSSEYSRHAGAAANCTIVRALEAVESRIEQRGQDLARAVGAEIGGQQRRRHPSCRHSRRSPSAPRIRRSCRGIGGSIALFALGAPSRLRHRPARHRPSPRGPSACRGPWRNSGRRSCAMRTCFRPSIALRSRARKPRALLGGVSRPSRKAWTRTGMPAASSSLRQRRHVILMRMHAARRQQAHQMRGAAALLELGDEVGERLVLGQRAVRDRHIDARQILHHDAAGADIHVADFGIAHLAAGQADDVSLASSSACGQSRMTVQFGVLASAMALSARSRR